MILASGTPFSDLYDVCVVGSGPGGLAVALGCARQGLHVCVLEAGPRAPTRRQEWPFIATIVDPARHVPLHVGGRSRLGGTSAAWGGLCVPLDAIDLERRSWVPHSGWPIGHDEIKRWEEPAADFLGSSLGFRTPSEDWEDLRWIDAGSRGHIARSWNLRQAYARELEHTLGLHLFPDIRVLRLELAAGDGLVTGLSVLRIENEEAGPRARVYVLAAGGLQSTSLLLDTESRHPGLFGGRCGPLGRFYMGHLTGEIATIVLNRPKQATELLYRTGRDGSAQQRRLRPRDETQRSAALLNTAFTLRTPPLTDSAHGSGALSLLFLASMVPVLRSAAKSDRFRKLLGTSRPGARQHVRNVLRHPWATLSDSARLLWMARVAKLPVMVPNSTGRYSLRYHAEQIPDSDSRVVLTHPSVSSAGARLGIDLRYQEEDARSILRAHAILDRALRFSGRERLDYWQPAEERMGAVLAQARDGFHQIGTTRMSVERAKGVVDVDCRVHGFSNLFIASSSVFPTSAAANPTFGIVCLGLRLADHVVGLLRRPAPFIGQADGRASTGSSSR